MLQPILSDGLNNMRGFDYLIADQDRHNTNLFINEATWQVRLIDHESGFTGRSSFLARATTGPKGASPSSTRPRCRKALRR